MTNPSVDLSKKHRNSISRYTVYKQNFFKAKDKPPSKEDLSPFLFSLKQVRFLALPLKAARPQISLRQFRNLLLQKLALLDPY